MQTLLAFLVALAILIAVHEYGHYRMAVACGVRVLRFSIGFGPTLWRRQSTRSPTEFVIGAFPLGGYVKMLDEREAPVDPSERHLAFNTQPLRSRALIVVAGPVANLLLAVLLYSVVNWTGVQEAAPVLAVAPQGSVAQRAGLAPGDRVLRGGFDDEAPEALDSFEDVRWLVTRGAVQGRDVRLVTAPAQGHGEQEHVLALAALGVHELDPATLEQIGLNAPLTRPEIGNVTVDSPAARAGLRPGDLVLSCDATLIDDGRQLRQLIRASMHEGQPQAMHWRIRRDGSQQDLDILPELADDHGAVIARIGAYVGAAPEMVTLRYGALQGLELGAERTWQVSMLTLRTMGKMIVGQASIKNLTGPLTIADYAGRSASMGLSAYLLYLALISVSLGVLNLLPLPVLDGGHLMYYLWEGVTGRSISQAWLERLQRAGVVVLALMMSVALFNDLSRLLG